ncbi:MAG: hypothetical protein KBF66_15000 [Rhodoferax sp.]|uniref:NifB/NifX family molybdenum-iron cluster-binding protein n=1 Tax=Rhodoferax sp. TaxID=50421 RepID=UPI001B4F0290|nr:NifB/NifX family molybdenum-iron cluster-binding protein [Rhodoferax sp.]MBP9906862.1 hypothetical protein [Rhodoferax sp.]
MKIAITSQNRQSITGHAGKCRKFWVYNVVDQQITGKQLIELAMAQSFHEVAHALQPSVSHPLDDIQVLITAGLGRGLQNRLLQKGIRAVATSETEPDQAVTAWLAGQLVEIAAESHEGAHHAHSPDDHESQPGIAVKAFVVPAQIGKFKPPERAASQQS